MGFKEFLRVVGGVSDCRRVVEDQTGIMCLVRVHTRFTIHATTQKRSTVQANRQQIFVFVDSKQHHYIGALKIGIGFWGILYYNYNKNPPPKKNSIGNQ